MIISTPEDALSLLGRYRNSDVEHIGIIAVKTNLEVIKVTQVGQGGVADCPLDRAAALRAVLKCPRANGFILWHNHPSGSVEPSREDLAITRAMVAAAKLVGLIMFDHIIVSGDRFRSLCRTNNEIFLSQTT